MSEFETGQAHGAELGREDAAFGTVDVNKAFAARAGDAAWAAEHPDYRKGFEEGYARATRKR